MDYERKGSAFRQASFPPSSPIHSTFSHLPFFSPACSSFFCPVLFPFLFLSATSSFPHCFTLPRPSPFTVHSSPSAIPVISSPSCYPFPSSPLIFFPPSPPFSLFTFPSSPLPLPLPLAFLSPSSPLPPPPSSNPLHRVILFYYSQH